MNITVPHQVRSRACYSPHLGVWCLEEKRLHEYVKTVNQIGIPKILELAQQNPPTKFSPAIYDIAEELGIEFPDAAVEMEGADTSGREPPAYINHQGTAIIPVSGPLSKHASSLQSAFGGSSTVGMRKALQMALRDPNIKRIMFHVDSPGGTVAGTGDLGDDIYAARKIKPTAAFAEDLAASAAYWLSSQTGTVFASPHAELGSIGVLHVVYDSSEAYAKEGIKVHVVKTGKNKGLGVDGVPVTDEYLNKVQAEVDRWNDRFVQTVARGRRMSESDVRKIADGSVFMADQAKSLGLVDHIGTFAQALAKFAGEPTQQAASQPVTATITNTAIGYDFSAMGSAGAAGITLPSGFTSTIELVEVPDSAANLVDSNTRIDVEESEAVAMVNEPKTPTTPEAGAQVSVPREELEALKRGAESGLRAENAVKELLAKLESKEKLSLDAERERLLSEYTGDITKEDVAACSDFASLKALEGVARRSKTQRAPNAKDAAPSAEDAKKNFEQHYKALDDSRKSWMDSITIPMTPRGG